MNLIAREQYANRAFAANCYAASGDSINKMSDRTNHSGSNPPNADNPTAVLAHC
ncbi:hypothetical protein [Microcoleus sp. FACHB-831]|uniref:hypothetical protein n=1 Tax=Microcoleus sp. FACHB-831 TaxID=2692827 RepID=UPI001682896A|nr:hypothetical protein [Microcoleus sp. FACHB-831]